MMTPSQVRERQALRTGVGRDDRFDGAATFLLSLQEPAHQCTGRASVMSTSRPTSWRRASRRSTARSRRARRRRARRTRARRRATRGPRRSTDGLDHAGDRLAVHREHRAGRGLEQHLVLFFVDREDRAEHAEVGHHLRARLHLRLQLLRVGLALARVAEHEEDQHRQDGEHDDSERIERHEGEYLPVCVVPHEVRRR